MPTPKLSDLAISFSQTREKNLAIKEAAKLKHEEVLKKKQKEKDDLKKYQQKVS